MNENQTKAVTNDRRADPLADWRRLPNKAFFFALLAAWALLFQFWGNSIFGYIPSPSLFKWLYITYNIDSEESDGSYANFIPFLVIGIFWWKRRELLALPLRAWWPAAGLLAAALALHVLGFLVQQPLVSTVALIAGVYALMGLAWGRAWLRHSAYPFFLFIFSVPLTSHLNFVLFPLRLFVVWLVEMVAHVVGISVIRHGTQLLDPSGNYGYDVVAACGGMRSLIAIFLMATVLAFGTLRGGMNRIFLMVLAVPFSVLGNMLRLLVIIIAAEMGGQKTGDYVHEGGPLGIISLLPYIPGMVGLLWASRWLERREAKNKSIGKEPA